MFQNQATNKWYSILLRAILMPSVQTFESYSRSYQRRNPYGWLLVGCFLANLGYIYNSLPNDIASVSCGTALALAIFELFAILIFVAFLNSLSRFFGGSGHYAQHLYVVVTFVFPLSVIAGFFMFIRLNSILILLSIYGLSLSIISTNAIHSIGWLKAVLSNVIVVVVYCVLVVTCIYLMKFYGFAS